MNCLPCLVKFCALAALLELDHLRLGQWMLSRPIVLGPLLGWWLDAAALGALLGAAVEILTLEELPLGSLVPMSGAVALSAALWVGVAAGAPGLGLAGGLLLGGAFRLVEARLRAAFGAFNADSEERWRRGQRPLPGLALTLAALTHLASCFALLLLGTRLLEWAARALRPWPGAQGFENALALTPVLGLAAFLSALRPRT